MLLLTLSTGVLFADPSAALSQARQKLFAMVAGDISRSLAAEERAADGAAILADGPIALMALNSIFPGSSVYAMGENSSGQLGIGTSSDTNTPVLLTPDAFGGPMTPGLQHSLAVDKDGNLWVTGEDTWGQFGDGGANSSTMTLFQTAQADIASVAAGAYHSLVVTNDGTVMAAGEGSLGQLGNGGTDTDTFTLIDIPGVVKTRSNGNNSFVITDQGELYVIGENQSGQLGTGGVGLMVYTPVRTIPGGVVDVAPGVTHTLVLMADGSVMAMGLNSYGQFGDSTTDSSPTPKVVIPSGVKFVAAGMGHSMFVMADGSLQAVGLNSYGQLGTGDTAVRNTLTTVANGVADVSVGYNHTLYVTQSGALMGMGNNSSGQLGVRDFSPRFSADTIATDGVAKAVAGYNSSFYMTNSVASLEITGLDRVYAGTTANFRCHAVWADGRRTDVTAEAVWSEDSTSASIELNTGILDLSAARPGETIRVSAAYFGETAAKDIAVIRTPLGGAVLYGSGDNAFSQLGLDTTVDQLVLTEVTTDRIISAAGGANHSLYVREDGSVFTMGDNTFGQLGTGDTVPRTAPQQITLARPAVAVGAGDHHSFIVMCDGSLYSMGDNDQGQLGDGTWDDRYSPTLIWQEGVVGVHGGADHSVFLTADGAVWAMGRNVEGQLGAGATDSSTTPFEVHAGGAAAISAGANHTLYTTDDAAMWGMGDNSRGQLGLGGSIAAQLTPTNLVPADVAHMAAGADHSTYATASGDLYLSGANDYGQQGNGTYGTDVLVFTLLDLGTAVNGVYAGANFTLFRTGTRTYTDTAPTDYTWYGTGSYVDGQLAIGTTGMAPTPVVLSYEQTYHQVKAVWPGNRHVLITRGLPGDIDGDVQFTLHDAVRALQIMSGAYEGWPISPYADVNGDGRVGLPEAQYVLRRVGGGVSLMPIRKWPVRLFPASKRVAGINPARLTENSRRFRMWRRFLPFPPARCRNGSSGFRWF